MTAPARAIIDINQQPYFVVCDISSGMGYYPTTCYIHATAFIAHQFFEVYVIVDQ